MKYRNIVLCPLERQNTITVLHKVASSLLFTVLSGHFSLRMNNPAHSGKPGKTEK